MITKENNKIKIDEKIIIESENRSDENFEDRYKLDNKASIKDKLQADSEEELDKKEKDENGQGLENREKSEDKPSQESENTDEHESMSLRSFLIDLIKYIVLIIVITNLLTSYVMQRTIVSGWSMEDTLSEGDNLIVEKVSYNFDNLDRFDIVAFYPNGKGSKEYYIKRIIGLPGEHVQIIDDEIYINGTILEEDYGNTDYIGYEGIAAEGIKLEEDEYFLLGDNRTESYDSRYRQIGAVQLDKIEGKAIFRIWPLNKFGTLD